MVLILLRMMLSIRVPALYPVFENLPPEYVRRDKLLSRMANSADILSRLYNEQGDFRFIPYFELFKYKSTAQASPTWHTVKHKILGENSYPNLIDTKILKCKCTGCRKRKIYFSTTV